MIAEVRAYHDGSKHHFHRFARSLGYLDWASQPNPFRSFAGSPAIPLSPQPGAPATAIGDVLRHALGLSAWKQFGAARPSTGSGRPEALERRWSLRVNPSSGNLHPTESYVVDRHGVSHYAPDRHALERRCAFDAEWPDDDSFLIALTSIHWREAWKYGERAFRYCQHDLGHAIGAIAIAAANAGLHAALLPEWSHADIAALTGIDRDEDFVEAEREEPGCLIAVRRVPVDDRRSPLPVRGSLLDAVRRGTWTGRANQLSVDHTTWTFIDEIAAATRDPGRTIKPIQLPDSPVAPLPDRALLLQRRSAVSFDGRSSLPAAAFLSMLSRVVPAAAPPWDALWWDPRVHLLIFVHRVDDLVPGLYLLARDADGGDRLRAACGRDFLWEAAGGTLPLFLLARGDGRTMARRLCCDQDIAADGFFSLGMIAEFDASLQIYGAPFYRQLFWETGVIGQVLYLEAEAAGARATGIGCFYDDPVHDVLGVADHAFQSLYHFTVGMPVDDSRLTTEPGYPWELRTLEPRT